MSRLWSLMRHIRIMPILLMHWMMQMITMKMLMVNLSMRELGLNHPHSSLTLHNHMSPPSAMCNMVTHQTSLSQKM